MDSRMFYLYIAICLLVIAWSLWKSWKTEQNYQMVQNTKEKLTVTGVNPLEIQMNRRDYDIQFRSPNPKFTDIPVVLPVHGYDDGLFSRLGLVYHNTNEEYKLPLFGKRDYPGSRHYRYYVLDHTTHQNKIELDSKEFLNNGDAVKVPGYPGHFTVHLNDYDFPQYHPNVIGTSGGPLPFPTVYA